MDAKFAGLLARLETVTAKLESIEVKPGGGAATDVSDAASEDVSPMVAAFDAFLAGEVADYVAKAGAIGMDDVAKQAALVKKAFESQREMLAIVSKCTKTLSP